jgi:hypothetical protein
MLKKLILCFLVFTSSLCSVPLRDFRLDPNALNELFLHFGIDPNGDVVEQTQEKWLRKPGQERWEMDELSDADRAFVFDWANRQALFSPWVPAALNFDNAVLLGASTHSMKVRVAYLVKLWTQGHRFNMIVWLTGERPLDPTYEEFTDHCYTEADAAQTIMAHSELPEEMRQLPILYIIAPMKEGNRPTRVDTVKDWLSMDSRPGSCLFISGQPFCMNDYAVMVRLLSSAIDFDVAGVGINPDRYKNGAAVLLDSIARYLYVFYN